MAAAENLAVRLGYSADARLLIINADDFGMCHAENVATAEGLATGAYTSATVMVPCPWFEAAVELARAVPGADVGVHITHTSEWEGYKWGPVCGRGEVRSLLAENGHFHPTVEAFHARALLKEIERETRAQIDRALATGLDVTHLDSHMGTLQLRPEHHALYVQLAAEYRLPLRTAGRGLLRQMGMESVLDAATRLGVLTPDHFWYGGPPAVEATEAYWTEVLRGLRPGVTEIYVHAAVDTPELRAISGSCAQRPADHAFFTAATTRQMLDDLGIELIGYREIRELQRRRSRC